MKRLQTTLSAFPLVLSLACTSAPHDADVGGSGGDPTTPNTGGSTNGTGGSIANSGGTVAATGGTVATGGTTTSGDYELVWSDEFDGDGALDTTAWSAENQPAGWVNSELQAYRGFRSENVRKENGFLVIEARHDNDGAEYSSARIHTQGKHEFLYGRFEARAKLPTAKGSWPAIWMMPSNIFKYATTCSAQTGWIAGCNAWPNSGEIDIMEHVGHDVGNVHATIHCADYNWQRPEQVTAETKVSDVGGTFHVYAMEWSPEKIEAFVDDVKFFSYDNPKTGSGSWPFDQPFYFILNIAVGGSWGGAQGVEPSQFPGKMEVDWVRAYAKK